MDPQKMKFYHSMVLFPLLSPLRCGPDEPSLGAGAHRAAHSKAWDCVTQFDAFSVAGVYLAPRVL